MMSSAVCGWSFMARRLQPGVGPALERAHSGLESLALRGEDVDVYFDAPRDPVWLQEQEDQE